MALKNFMATRGGRDAQADIGSAQLPGSSERPPRTVAPSTSIDAKSELKGTLRCKETLRIDGRVKGEVTCDKTVIVGEGGRVHASIVADTVEVSGEVKGDITASCKITLDRTARVTGDLATPGIVIEEGAKLEGRIVIGVDQKPAEQAKAGGQAKAAAQAKPAEEPRPEPKRARNAAKPSSPPPA